MFASRKHSLDFADTCLDRGFSVPNFGRLENIDPLEQIAHAESADLKLLRLVGCAALATLLMAVASSLA